MEGGSGGMFEVDKNADEKGSSSSDKGPGDHGAAVQAAKIQSQLSIEVVTPRFRPGESGKDSRCRDPVTITIPILATLFHEPLSVASAKLGISTTALKRVCRKLGVPRWPFTPDRRNKNRSKAWSGSPELRAERDMSSASGSTRTESQHSGVGPSTWAVEDLGFDFEAAGAAEIQRDKAQMYAAVDRPTGAIIKQAFIVPPGNTRYDESVGGMPMFPRSHPGGGKSPASLGLAAGRYALHREELLAAGLAAEGRGRGIGFSSSLAGFHSWQGSGGSSDFTGVGSSGADSSTGTSFSEQDMGPWQWRSIASPHVGEGNMHRAPMPHDFGPGRNGPAEMASFSQQRMLWGGWDGGGADEQLSSNPRGSMVVGGSTPTGAFQRWPDSSRGQQSRGPGMGGVDADSAAGRDWRALEWDMPPASVGPSWREMAAGSPAQGSGMLQGDAMSEAMMHRQAMQQSHGHGMQPDNERYFVPAEGGGRGMTRHVWAHLQEQQQHQFCQHLGQEADLVDSDGMHQAEMGHTPSRRSMEMPSRGSWHQHVPY